MWYVTYFFIKEVETSAARARAREWADSRDAPLEMPLPKALQQCRIESTGSPMSDKLCRDAGQTLKSCSKKKS